QRAAARRRARSRPPGRTGPGAGPGRRVGAGPNRRGQSARAGMASVCPGHPGGRTVAGAARRRGAGAGRRFRRPPNRTDPAAARPVTPSTDWLARAWDAIDRDRLVELVAALVRFPSVTPPGEEEPIARFLAERFRASGLAAEIQEVAPGRANAIGRLGPAGGR